jgi:hypothetical protein
MPGFLLPDLNAKEGEEMKAIAIGTVILSLSACASIPDNSEQLVASTEVKQTSCYSQMREEVSQKVKSFLEQCYRIETVVIPIAGVPVPLTSNYQVVEERGEDLLRYSVRSKYGFGLAFDISSGGENCQTQVDMYALRGHLREKFDRVDAAINGENPGCGII